MDLHLLLLEPAESGSKIDPIEFEQIKDNMLRSYDEAKKAKRDVKSQKRSWEYKKAYDQRSENELTALESRVAELKTKRSQELEEAVAEVTNVADRADNQFSEIVSTFESSRRDLEAYANAGKLSMAQTAFLEQIGQFFEDVARGHEDEYFSLKEDSKMSATTEKFTKKGRLASDYAEELMADYYYGVSEFQEEWSQYSDQLDDMKTNYSAKKDSHHEEVASIEAQIEAAKAADNKDLVKKLMVALAEMEKSFSEEAFDYNKSVSKVVSLREALDRQFADMVEDMQKKVLFVHEAINAGEVFEQTGEPMTAEHLYKYAKDQFAGEALKAAYAELDAKKAEYAKFDDMLKNESEARLAEVNSGIEHIGQVSRDLSSTKKNADVDEYNAFIAAVTSDMDEVSVEIEDIKGMIDATHAKIEATEISLKEKQVELAGLDPASPTYAADKAALEEDIEITQNNIAYSKTKVENLEVDLKQLHVELRDMEELKAGKTAGFEQATADIPQLEALYVKVKDRVIAKQIEYSDFLISSEADRRKLIEEIAAAEDAVEVADEFAVIVRFGSGSLGKFSISGDSPS